MSRPGRRAVGDAGETLIEVLVALTIVATAFVAIIGGLGTMVFGSDIHRRQVDAGALAVTAAEHVKSAPHVPCAVPATYEPAADAAPRPDGWGAATVTVSSVAYWDGTAFGTTCFDDAAHGHVLTSQLVTVTVASPEGRGTDTVTVAKRREV